MIPIVTNSGFDAPTNVFMASEVRSGSTYVAELISYSLNTSFGFELWDLTREMLREIDDSSTADEIRNRIGNLWLSPDNIRSSKMMCAELSVLTRWARVDPAVEELVAGPRTRWIIVRRRNKIRQAVSLATARRSGVYHSYADPSGEEPTEVSMQDIESALRAIILSDEYLRLFSAVPSICAEVFYEDVCEEPTNTITDALNRIGLLPDGLPLRGVEAKLRRDRQDQKDQLETMFNRWILENHHPTQL